MLAQEVADYLIDLEKKIINTTTITFPTTNDITTLEAISIDEKEKFLLDINRKGTFKLTRCTYQTRYRVENILVRLDIDTKPHRNPDNKKISPTHIHIYKEGYGLRWAYPLEEFKNYTFTNTKDFFQTFSEFCGFCNVKKLPFIQGVI